MLCIEFSHVAYRHPPTLVTGRTRYITNKSTGDDALTNWVHQAGSVAGEVLHIDQLVSSQMSRFNGMAKHARLAVYDLGPKSNVSLCLAHGTSQSSLVSMKIRIPGNLYKDLYEIIVADTDAKISSNSWGAPLEVDSDGIYDQYALATDKFVWDHQVDSQNPHVMSEELNLAGCRIS